MKKISILMAAVIFIALSLTALAAAAEPSAAVCRRDLPQGTFGKPYSVKILDFDDAGFEHMLELIPPEYDYSGLPGILPAGLELSDDGVIFGTPTNDDGGFGVWKSFDVKVSWDNGKEKAFANFNLQIVSEDNSIAPPSPSMPVAPFRTDITIKKNTAAVYKFVAPSTSFETRDGEPNVYDADGQVIPCNEQGGDENHWYCGYYSTPGRTYYLYFDAKSFNRTVQLLPYAPAPGSFAGSSITLGSSLVKTGEGEDVDTWTYTNLEDDDFDVSYGWITHMYGMPYVLTEFVVTNDAPTLEVSWTDGFLDSIYYADKRQYYWSSLFEGTHVDGNSIFTFNLYVPHGTELELNENGYIRAVPKVTPGGGDIDGSGVVSMHDALWALMISCGKLDLGDNSPADINGDFVVDAKDALVILTQAINNE